MPLPHDLDWIQQRFDPFTIVYLDSLACGLPSATFGLSRLTPGRSSRPFADQLAGTLRIQPAERTVANYLDPKGLGTRFKKDRNLQKAVAGLMTNPMTGGPNAINSYQSLDLFYQQRNTLLKDGSTTEALVVLDTMFACRLVLPEDLNLALPDKVEGDSRYVECVLIDEHPKLLTWYDQHIMLSVDRRAFYEWTEEFTRILTVGWHPFTRTIGYYTTSAGGQPFIRVLAILMQPYPPLSDFLPSRRGSADNLHTVLTANLNTMRQIIQNYAAAATASNTAPTAPPAASPPSGPAADSAPPSSPTGAALATPSPTLAEPAKLAFPEYRRLMYPVYVAQTLCSLNGVSAIGLQQRAKPTYDLLALYLEQLQRLHDYKDFLSPQVLMMAPPSGIETLLEEPKRYEGQDLAIYE